MHITASKVQNYRCLRNASTTLSEFTTVIGENNAGKSSFLQALSLFIRGTKLTPADYYDPTREIVIEAEISGITDKELDTLGDHRDRIAALITDHKLRLVRRYRPDGSSSLRVIRPVPKDHRYRTDVVNDNLKGKTGPVLRDYLAATYPEHVGRFSDNTQAQAKQVIEEISSALPPSQLEEEETDLPTGIDNSIKTFLPEPIYIPAVKDLTDDVKTKETTSFGKLLSVLFNVIGGQFVNMEADFASLNEKLNIIQNDDGSFEDRRLSEVREIEDTVSRYVRENFPNIKLEIQVPPPEIKAILSSARVVVDDGISGTIETKGDGLKRAVTFAILRSYITLSTKPEWQKPGGKEGHITDRYLFLFEEPELYLHPKAQMILFDALSRISENHQVVISTHSPMFLSPSSQGTFIKISKTTNTAVKPPYSILLPVDLSPMEIKDLWRLICYENNSAAFFAERIVLIEGDSDHICYCHIAKTLNPDWDFSRHRIALVRAGGKGNLKRYRGFFERFGVRMFIIADLDVVIKDFDKLGLPDDINKQREQLLACADQIIVSDDLGGKAKGAHIKDGVEKLGWLERWARFKAIAASVMEGTPVTEEEIALIEELLEIERDEPRLCVLKSHPSIQQAKQDLLSRMRQYGVFVLDKGAIEDYYPCDVTGRDKPSKAQAFCKLHPDRESINRTCNTISTLDEQTVISEFEAIFGTIFSEMIVDTTNAEQCLDAAMEDSDDR
jgi:putative ATP-dependent endonuclease of the OLD family